MKEYRYKYGDKPNIPPCVMALGYFDGVHIGHRELLSRAKERAARFSLPLGVFTFSSSDKIKPDATRIYEDEEKAQLLSELGVDFVIFADFESVRTLTPETFVKEVLLSAFNTQCAVCGYNYKFGVRAAADAEELRRLMNAEGGESIICERFDWGGCAVSATRIRELLSKGNIKEANALLGAPYRVKSEVKAGNKFGHSLGYPTVNTEMPSKLLRRGVYISAVRAESRVYKALTNVGTCPTFRERAEHLESYILDFDGNLYEKEITVYLLDFIRDEKRFSTEKELIMQINIDKNTLLERNGDLIWEQAGLK